MDVKLPTSVPELALCTPYQSYALCWY